MTDRDEYLKRLSSMNGYCSCPTLRQLFEAKKIAKSLETECESLGLEVDLKNPQSSDEKFLKHYEQKARRLQEAITIYHSLLDAAGKNREVRFKLHTSNPWRISGNIQYEEARNLMNEPESDLVISVHCAKCDQQVELSC